MVKPESLDVLLSPSLRVSRPVAACSRCRGAKIKCDGKLPSCTACERSGKADTCSDANDEFAKGKERSYVAALEAAAERLQKKINDARSSGSPVIPAKPFAGQPSVGKTSGQAVSLRRLPSDSRARRKEASNVDDLVGDFGFLSVNATSRDFHGFTSTMSFARLLLSVSMQNDIPLFDAYPLPPRYAAIPLIQYYLDNIFVLLPFFSETELITSISAVYQDAGRRAVPLNYWFVRMVLAISSAATSEIKGDTKHQNARRQISGALKYAEAVLHPGAITGIQAILLLVQYAMLDPSQMRCWDLIGIASRVMVDLGLHVEPSPEAKISKDALDLRRRVFYCVYALDRQISLALGHTFSFTDDSASVFLPVVANPTAPSKIEESITPQLFLSSLRPSLFLFDIRRVQSTFYQATHASGRTEWPSSTVQTYTTSVLNDIHAWFGTIPASLPQRHISFFRLELLYSQIMALAPSSCIPFAKLTGLNRTLIFEFVIQYVDEMLAVLYGADNNAFVTFLDIQRFSTIGRLFREILWSNLDDLLSGGIPHSPGPVTRAGCAQRPPIFVRSTSRIENCARVTACLHKIMEILDYALRRWGMGEWRVKFEQESAVLLEKLKNKQQELNTPQYYQQVEGMQQPQESWPRLFMQSSSQDRQILNPDTRSSRDQTDAGSRRMNAAPAAFELPSTSQILSCGMTEDSHDMSELPPGSLPRRTYQFAG